MDKLMEKYNKVFDENGRPKFCDRQTCVDLIEACEEKFPDVDFGIKSTGWLNKENIKKYLGKE